MTVFGKGSTSFSAARGGPKLRTMKVKEIRKRGEVRYLVAGKVALQAGNTEKVLFNHYLKLVSKADAEKFWNIYPEDAGTQFQVVAA